MAAPKPLTAGEQLRAAADELYRLAEAFDVGPRSITHLQQLHDEVEQTCADGRAVVRGRPSRRQ